MKKLLLCLATHYLWLFENYGFRIIDSLWQPGFCGQGMIELSDGILRIRFLTDRDQMYADFRPVKSGWPEEEFITVDLLYSRIVGSYIDTAMVNEQTTRFLKNHFNDIKDLFEKGDGNKLFTEFKKLKKERSKRLFG